MTDDEKHAYIERLDTAIAQATPMTSDECYMAIAIMLEYAAVGVQQCGQSKEYFLNLAARSFDQALELYAAPTQSTEGLN